MDDMMVRRMINTFSAWQLFRNFQFIWRFLQEYWSGYEHTIVTKTTQSNVWRQSVVSGDGEKISEFYGIS